MEPSQVILCLNHPQAGLPRIPRLWLLSRLCRNPPIPGNRCRYFKIETRYRLNYECMNMMTVALLFALFFQILLELKNVSSSSRQLRITPPTSKYFSVGLGK